MELDLKRRLGLPCWCSGRGSTCQCQGHGLDPQSGKTPPAVEHLSPCTTTTEPRLQSLEVAGTEARTLRAYAVQQEKPLQSSPCLLQTEKACA